MNLYLTYLFKWHACLRYFLYVLNYVALLKHIFNLTLHYKGMVRVSADSQSCGIGISYESGIGTALALSSLNHIYILFCKSTHIPWSIP